MKNTLSLPSSTPFLLLLSIAFTGVSTAKAELTLRSISPTGDWKIVKTEWSASDEDRFSGFVAAIGKSGCNSMDSCLKNAANPYRSSDPAGSKFFSDCADLPYVLRTYFAWKNGLPFGYVSSVSANPVPLPTPMPSPAPAPRDIRYSAKGNKVDSRTSVVSRIAADGSIIRPSGLRTLQTVLNTISSAIFRVGPASENPLRPTDFYPVALNRKSLRPGTAIYDPAGHVAVVYSVEDDGRVLFIDAHPDNSLTHGTYGKKFSRSSPAHGAGFKDWRPVKLVGATQNTDGEWIGGKVVPVSNAELPGYSTVQFYGTNPDAAGSWNRGKFVFDGNVLEYYDYLRRVLSKGTLHYEPLNEFALLLRGLCSDLKDRVTSVDLAVLKGIHLKAHPDKLPSNIYGSEGEWEDFATPSRDARLKTSLKEARDRAAEFMTLWQSHDPSIDYSGTNLKADLYSILQRESAACSFAYTKSDGTKQALTLIDSAHRAFAISFDPYHCPELRWGASSAGELSTCGDDATKRAWYSALRKLRNQIDRTYDARMDFSLTEMADPAKGGALGMQTPPDVDFEALLR